MAKRVWACGLGHPALCTASFTTFCNTDSCRWCLRFSPVTLSVKWLVAGNTHCHPTLSRVGIFALKGVGQSDSAQASLKIALVLSSNHIKVFVISERFSHHCGKHRVPIFVLLAGSDNYLITGEIDIFDPQPRTFHQSQTGSVEKHGHEPIGAIEATEYRLTSWRVKTTGTSAAFSHE